MIVIDWGEFPDLTSGMPLPSDEISAHFPGYNLKRIATLSATSAAYTDKNDRPVAFGTKRVDRIMRSARDLQEKTFGRLTGAISFAYYSQGLQILPHLRAKAEAKAKKRQRKEDG